MDITIDRTKTYQTFRGFGASGAWWAQCVGGWTHADEESGLPVPARIAQLLYDPEAGIGLHTYRYNLGGGSAESGKGEIGNPLRRTESFETAPGVYDFSRDANAVAMLKLAVRYGAKEVVLFVNSPLERLTKNGLTHCSKSRPFLNNLPAKNRGAFAKYVLDAAAHFLAEGVPVRYVSPINEPLWIWNGGQEGCHYDPIAAGKTMNAFAEEMDRRPALDGVRLSGLENGDIRWFNKIYTRHLMRYESVRRRVDAVDLHSYFLPPPLPLRLPFLQDRQAFLRRFYRWTKRRWPEKEIRMSEWCHMQGGRDKGMDSALIMANVIWEDLSILNASAWQHWIAVSEVDYCDGLIYINLPEKTFELTKRYFVTGNFSKYIPLGAKRVSVASPDPTLKLLCFEKEAETVLVAINDSFAAKEARLPAPAKKRIVTDETRDLCEEAVCGRTLPLPPRSVTTVLL